MNTPSDLDQSTYVAGIVVAAVITALIYAVHVHAHGLFLRRINEKPYLKYVLAVFPAVLLSSLFWYAADVLKDADRNTAIFLIALFVLFFHYVLHWRMITSRHSCSQYIDGGIFLDLGFVFALPVLGIAIMYLWVFFSRNRPCLLLFYEETEWPISAR